MKKINLKKLAFKKTNVIELNAAEAIKVVGGSITEVEVNLETGPRSIFTGQYCMAVAVHVNASN